ncbi:MAG: hypothetical protein ACR2MX_00855 [Cyclobacteriaceae bacterium]
MRSFLLLFLLLVPFRLCYSQTEPLALSVPLSSQHFDLVPLSNQGFIILEFQKGNSQQSATLHLQCFDTLLQKAWQSNLALSPRTSPVLTKVSDDHYYLITSDASSRSIEIFEVGLNNGQAKKTSHRFSSPFFINDMVAYNHQVWLSGTMLNQGALFSILLQPDQQPKIMPVGFIEPVKQVTQLSFDLTSKTISYFLYSSLKKQKVYIFRQTDVLGKVRADLVIKGEPKHHLGQLKSTLSNGNLFLAGTYFKQQGDQPLGIFTSQISQGQLAPIQFSPFKEILLQKLSYEDLIDRDQESSFSKKDWGPTVIDSWEFGPEGLLLALEIVNKDYQVKGTLQREFEKQEIIARIDQNTYGRRDMDQAAAQEGETLDDRMSNYSATDITQYRYLDAIVGQAQFKGYNYDRTVMLTFDAELNLKSTQSVKMGSHRVYFGRPGNVRWQGNSILLGYQQGENYRQVSYDPETQYFSQPKAYSTSQNGVVLPWYMGRYLVGEIAQEKGEKQLELKRLEAH